MAAKLKIFHPGDILNLEFMQHLENTAYKLSKENLVPQTRILEIIEGTNSVSDDTSF